MRRVIVSFVLLAAAMMAFLPGSTSANGDPCSNPENATKSISTPGTLNGTSKNDILFGSTGNDVINGKGGNDIICGNGGTDEIHGGSGADSIEAVDGSWAYGDAGADEIWVSGSNDPYQVSGDDDSDGAGYGGSGNDYIFASNGAYADGGSGNDYILLWNAPAAYGGSGSDYIYNESGLPYVVDCGTGNDVYEGEISINGFDTEVISCENNRRKN